MRISDWSSNVYSSDHEAVRIEPVAITSINVDVPTAAIGVFIGEEIEIAVDLVDCLVEFGSDRLSFVEGQRRSQQFHAGEAAFRPIQDRKSTRLNSSH